MKSKNKVWFPLTILLGVNKLLIPQEHMDIDNNGII